MTRQHHLLLSCSLALVAGGLACGPKSSGTTNADMVGAYSDNKYKSDMVTADEYEEHEDQGDAISPRTLANIDDTILSVYTADFEACLEKEMERLETKWLAGTFTVEFRIDTSGKVHDVNVLNMDVKERKGFEGEPRVADQFDDCLKNLLVEWQFDPPPEAEFVHTYNGELGEAW
ncbi:MAG: hypothetical protein B7733_01685 [Myxococcales bacterium FL481]|nr:MAG: hypothetical protein B7733_01685 [Myxococcales bacterium FL481]